MKNKGKIFLIPCGLGGENESEILPAQTIALTNELDEFIVEKEKTARHFLKRIGYEKPLNDLILHPLNKHTQVNDVAGYLKSCKAGKDIGLISEAGCPAVADPGAAIVEIAHEAGIQVVPLVGPSSILMALMASGMCFMVTFPKTKEKELDLFEEWNLTPNRKSKVKYSWKLLLETIKY